MRGLHALIFMLLRPYVLVPHQNLAFVSLKQTKSITIDGLRLRLLRLEVDLRAILVRRTFMPFNDRHFSLSPNGNVSIGLDKDI